MPRCDGVPPDGRCPHNATGRNVKGTQGDLMLCPACDAVRFPVPTTNAKHTAATKPTVSSSKKVGDKKQPSDTKSCHTNINCTVCRDDTDEPGVMCDICSDCFHKGCTGLPGNVFDTLLTILKDVGWVCSSCRATSRGRLDSLSTALSRATEEIADMRVIVNSLKTDIASINTDEAFIRATSLAETRPAESVAESSPVRNLQVEIRKTLNDIDRRKRNVIITGLPETSSEELDQAAFSDFCEMHMITKPSLSQLGCRRLGRLQNPQDRPRRLLVHLNSEACASDLLKAAKDLRSSSDPSARSVYINPDLDPASAKLAYEKRERRRQLRRGQTTNDGTSSHSMNITTSTGITHTSDVNRSPQTNYSASADRSADSSFRKVTRSTCPPNPAGSADRLNSPFPNCSSASA